MDGSLRLEQGSSRDRLVANHGSRSNDDDGNAYNLRTEMYGWYFENFGGGIASLGEKELFKSHGFGEVKQVVRIGTIAIVIKG